MVKYNTILQMSLSLKDSSHRYVPYILKKNMCVCVCVCVVCVVYMYLCQKRDKAMYRNGFVLLGNYCSDNNKLVNSLIVVGFIKNINRGHLYIGFR